MTPLLEVKNLCVDFKTENGIVRAVDRAGFVLAHGEALGLVGESGCGKTVTALSLLRLIPSPPGKISEGQVLFEGKDLLSLPGSSMRRVRGKDIAMIFQEPMTALNPVLTIESQMTEVLRRHTGASRKLASNKALELLKLVSIPSPESRLGAYPHELSGGMRQRVMIAMALSCGPKLLVADEPTTALDVTIQAQVLEQIRELRGRLQMALILVSHDLAVIAEVCRRVVVMYCGRVIEQGKVDELFDSPRHWYTKGLLESMPRIRDQKVKQLPTIEGMVPDLARLPQGCAFADRCPRVEQKCREQIPPLTWEKERAVACFFPYDGSIA